jgi:hypothetical protein
LYNCCTIPLQSIRTKTKELDYIRRNVYNTPEEGWYNVPTAAAATAAQPRRDVRIGIDRWCSWWIWANLPRAETVCVLRRRAVGGVWIGVGVRVGVVVGIGVVVIVISVVFV